MAYRIVGAGVGVVGAVVVAMAVIAPNSDEAGLSAPPAYPSYPAAQPISGTETTSSGTVVHNAPNATAWPAAAGPWNAKAPRYNKASDRIAFETFRSDDPVKGGSLLRRELTGDTQYTAVPANRASQNLSAAWVFNAAKNPLAIPASPAPVSDVIDAGANFVAGWDVRGVEGTSYIFVAAADGTAPKCLGCDASGVPIDISSANALILRAVESPNGTPPPTNFTPVSETIYKRQNRDMPVWTPSGDWIIATVEMPIHAGFHSAGNGEVGMFTNLYAIFARPGDPDFGKIWIKLTDVAPTWGTRSDNVALMPYDASEPKCLEGRQYGTAGSTGLVPYDYYHCSAAGLPPVTSGFMRPTVSSVALANGNVPIAWGARVGVALTLYDASCNQLTPASGFPGGLAGATAPLTSMGLAGGGVQLLGQAELKFVAKWVQTPGGSLRQLSLPTIVNKQLIAPTANEPTGARLGVPLWKGTAVAGATPAVGHWYEAWDYSYDNAWLLFASDIFRTTRPSPSQTPAVGTGATFPYMDVVQWKRDKTQVYTLSRYLADPGATNHMDYLQNSSTPIFGIDTKDWGYWEEPAVYVYDAGLAKTYLAFGSNAGIFDQQVTSHNPPTSLPGNPAPKGRYNMASHAATLGLETWLMDLTVGDIAGGTGTGFVNDQVTGVNDYPMTPPPNPNPLGVCPNPAAVRSVVRLRYPSDYNDKAASARFRSIYLTDVPAGFTGGANPPGLIYVLDANAAIARIDNPPL